MLALFRSSAFSTFCWMSCSCPRVAIRASSNRTISRGTSSASIARSTDRTSLRVMRKAGPMATPGETPVPFRTISLRASLIRAQSS